jgi:hypothetical protein
MPHALHTHEDFRAATTADLLALFQRTPLSEQAANELLSAVFSRPLSVVTQ